MTMFADDDAWFKFDAKQERFEKFTAKWQQEHRGKYPSALEYFNAIWELSELETSEFWIDAMKELVTGDTLGRLAERVEAKIEDKEP